MATATESIADNWEHIDNDDDAFSIVSLPASERDSPNPSRVRPALSASSSPSDSLAVPPRRLQSRSEGRTDRDPANSHVAEGSGISTAAALGLRELVDVGDDGEFDYIFNTTHMLFELISQMLADPLFPSFYLVGPDVWSRYASIGSHLGELERILAVYARHQKLGDRLFGVPVGLSAWLRRLESDLLIIKETLGHNLRDLTIPPDTAVSLTTQVKDHFERLKGLAGDMDGFMVLIQGDYEHFRVLHMPTTMASAEDSCAIGHEEDGRMLNHVTFENNNLAHLRRELFTLKDQIVACLGEIHSCKHHGISRDAGQYEGIAQVTLSYKKTKDLLSMMLSYPGCDWIDCSITGGLTYPEFCQLNPDTIRSLILQLKEVTDDLFLERSTAQALRNDSNGRYRKKLIIGQDTMETLRTTEEVLVSILQVR